MKRIKYISVFSLMALCLLFVTSCDNDETADVTKPQINLIEPCEGDELLIGDEHGVHFEAEFVDNVMLSSYMIEIHSNFNDHNHATRSSDDATVAFSYKKSFDLSGKVNAYVHHHDIIIPANATPGKYHLMIYCTDAAGNESWIARNIVLSHTAGGHHDE